MVVALRVFGLIIYVAAEHFRDGLAYPALILGALIGWRAIPFYWLAAPTLGLAYASSRIYFHATGPGKVGGAMGNFAFELAVFGFLSLVGYLAARWWRNHRAARPTKFGP